MRLVRKVMIAAVILIVALVLATAGCRQVLQHRAIFPGGLTFVGAADGLSESRYHRVYLWRPPEYIELLPAVAVHIEDKTYELDALTPELFAELEAIHGTLFDSAGASLQCRFTNGQLTWFSIDAAAGPARAVFGGNVKAGQFALSRDGGPAVALPVSRQHVEASLGLPEAIRWMFAQ